jgi:D-psicose/D-tagatose/L-ribulose 3-epimerase
MGTCPCIIRGAMTTWMTKSLIAFAPVCLALAGACSHTPPPAPAAVPPAPVDPVQAAPAALDVKVGRCADVDKLAESKAAGFDYVELGTRNIAKLSDAELEAALAKHKEVGLPTPVANVFLPNEMKVVGPAVDEAALLAYAKKAFDRMSRFGVQIIVFGSGGARKVPEGFSKEEAFNQLVAFAKLIAPEAQAKGITLAVEPLKSQETNIINTAAEGLKWVKAVNHPNFQLMVDFYHLASEKEDPKILVEARDSIKHFHIANPNKRVFPLSATEYDYAGFFENLRKMDYHGRISVEASTKDFANEGPRALAFLRTMLGQKATVASKDGGIIGLGNLGIIRPAN